MRKKKSSPYYQEYEPYNQDYSLPAFIVATFQCHDADTVISTQYLLFSLWIPVMNSDR